MAEGGLSINRSQESIDERSLEHDSTIQVPYTLLLLCIDSIFFFLFFSFYFIIQSIKSSIKHVAFNHRLRIVETAFTFTWFSLFLIIVLIF